MRRNSKKEKKSSPIPKYIILGVFVIFIISVSVIKGSEILRDSPHFKIKRIVVDPSISFVKSRELSRLKGKSLFDVNIKSVSQKLRYRYPQVSQLKVIKRFPNEIYVIAQRRDVFAQAVLNNRTISIDKEGVVLSREASLNTELPLVVNIRPKQRGIDVGEKIKGKNIQVGLSIIKMFRRDQLLSSFPVKKIDIANLSKINIFITSNIKIIVDQDGMEGKFRILGMLLSQGKIKLDEIKYVDLRFKEPVVRKR